MTSQAPYIYFIILNILVSLKVYSTRNVDFPYLKTFPLFLLLTLGVEFLGNYLSSAGFHNVILYNLFSILGCCYFQWLISRMISSRKVKNLIRVTIAGYIIISLANMYLFQTDGFLTVTYSLGCLLAVAECIYFFLELFRNPKAVNLISNPNFWICSAVLFWYSSTFPLYGYINYWSKISRLVVVNFESIVTILNIFFYSLFTIAFLCMKPRKYISSPL
ncbi:MAG: hypothetical protein EOO05_02925 [Chitinophagaceae bacterium]|nr:MAG: hypothetical protein EOO05_02925 [Chitinophagaceae bacterium]